MRAGLVALAALPALFLVFRGLYSIQARGRIDDRLLIDIVAEELHQVDMADPNAHSQPLFGFALVKHVALLETLDEQRQFKRCRVSIVPSNNEPLTIFVTGIRADCVPAAEALARVLKVPLERSEKIEKNVEAD